MIELSIDMKAEYFIFHPGRLAFYSLSSQKVFFMEQRYPERIGEVFHDSIRKIIGFAAGRVKLCLENTHTVISPFLRIIEKLADQEGLGLVWDVGHVEQLSEAKRQQMLKFFQDNARHVKLGHLHDIKGKSDHKTLGSGKLNVAGYLEVFKALSLDIVLEIFPEGELLKSLEYIRNINAHVGQSRER